MAEYINRAELIENLNKFAPEHYNALINHLITKQPTADVVEVVRCKDCKFRGTDDCLNSYYSEYEGAYVDPMDDDDFCSYGERRKRRCRDTLMQHY